MEKLVAVVFSNEKAAYDGIRVLSDMNAAGSMDVPVMYLLKKESESGVSTKEVFDHYVPVRTVAGTALGAVLGALAGPVGAGAGAGVGAFAGLIWDLYSIGVDQDFFSDVATALTPGKCAVVAEVDEEWVSPLDTLMEELGGVVYRTPKPSVQEEHWWRETANTKTQLELLKTELAQAHLNRKAKLQAQLEKLRERIDAKLARAQERSQQATREYEAKLRHLQQKADKQKGDAKAAVEARIAKLRQDYQSQVHA
ncbi:MAG TPA: DUF1269 domain-containing protein [Steroidobacteraceae bacterium]|nr:DUF1269 domain-containing protein [Steroidobacteraceae bacterium]